MDGFMKIFNVINYLDYRPKYEQSKCIKSVSPKAKCTICKDVCPRNVISINKRSITIGDTCDACNECVSHCPTNCLVDTGKRFLKYEKKVFVLCGQHRLEGDLDPGLKLTCLNFINRKILLNLYRSGFREIYTNLDKCSECSRSNNIHMELERTNEVLDKLNKPLMTLESISTEDLLSELDKMKEAKSHTEVDRRGFFMQIAKEVYSKTYEITPPSSREQFWYTDVEILSNWQKDKEDKLSLYNIIIDNQKCIECQACVKLCPQKVWTIEDDKKEHDLSLCNGCNLCRDTCPGKAIEIKDELILRSKTSYKKVRQNCEKCSKEFSTYKENFNLCPTCIGKEIFK